MKSILLTNGMNAVVDDEDFDWLRKYRWNRWDSKRTSYARRTVKRTATLMMHIAVMRRYGLLREGCVVNHKNENGLDNQKANLESVSYSYNASVGITGRRGGVWFDRTNRKWKPSISVYGKRRYFGNFPNKVLARKALESFIKKNQITIR